MDWVKLLYLGKVCGHSSSLVSPVTTLLYLLTAFCHSFKLQHSSSLIMLLFRQLPLSCSTFSFFLLESSFVLGLQRQQLDLLLQNNSEYIMYTVITLVCYCWCANQYLYSSPSYSSSCSSTFPVLLIFHYHLMQSSQDHFSFPILSKAMWPFQCCITDEIARWGEWAGVWGGREVGDVINHGNGLWCSPLSLSLSLAVSALGCVGREGCWWYNHGNIVIPWVSTDYWE